MKKLMTLLLALLTAMVLILSGCGGGGSSGGGVGSNSDRDADGIPDTGDRFPDDPARFADYATVLLDRLTGGQFSAAVAINGADQVVGLSENSDGKIKAVKWTVASAGDPLLPTELPPLEADGYSAAYGINDAGVTVGEAEAAGNFVAVVWPAEGSSPAPLSLTGFSPPAAAYGINGSRIVGEATAGGNPVAVLWRDPAGEPTALGTLGGETSAAYYINSAGMIVGESQDGDGAGRGTLWFLDDAGNTGLPVTLGPLEGHVASVALGVNRAGEVVGESESASGEIHAVVWTLSAAGVPGPPTDLGIGSGNAINDGGRIAGSSGIPRQAVAWDIRNPSLADAFLTGNFGFSQGYGMNEWDLVVGQADSQGFVAVPLAQ